MTSMEIDMSVVYFILNPCCYAACVVMKLWNNIFIPLWKYWRKIVTYIILGHNRLKVRGNDWCSLSLALELPVKHTFTTWGHRILNSWMVSGTSIDGCPDSSCPSLLDIWMFQFSECLCQSCRSLLPSSQLLLL